MNTAHTTLILFQKKRFQQWNRLLSRVSPRQTFSIHVMFHIILCKRKPIFGLEEEIAERPKVSRHGIEKRRRFDKIKVFEERIM